MITVKTKLQKSKVHGIGLFADQFIPKGTVTWRYSPKYDQSFSKEEVSEMNEITLQQFFKYAYWDATQKKFILCFDDQRFVNHSKEYANVESTPEQDIAIRDIQPDEEILCDYSKFDPTYFDRIGLELEKKIRI